MPHEGLPAPLRGIIIPLITPLLDRDALDCAGLERLIEHVLAGGVSGIFILGTTGEGPSLSHRLRREMIHRTCRQVHGRAPVLVGITDTSFVDSVELGRTAADEGASGVVAAAPYYFITSQHELSGWLVRLTARLTLPLFLYNMPSLSKVGFEPETVARAAEIPGIAGLKDSSGSMIYLHRVHRLVREREDFSLLVGPEELLAESVLTIAHGGVCGGANMFPRLYVDLYRAAFRGDREEALRLHGKVMELSCGIYQVGTSASGYLRGLKCAVSLLGICAGAMAEPYEPLDSSEAARIRVVLERLGLPVPSSVG